MAFADYLGVPPAEMLSWQLAISDSDREYAKQFIDPTRKNLIISPVPVKLRKIGWLSVMRKWQILLINIM